MTDVELRAIRERYEAATPFASRRITNDDSTDIIEVAIIGRAGATDADAELIAHAPGDIAALLAEVERLRAFVRWVAAELPDYPSSVRQHEEARRLLGIADGEGGA